MPLVLMDVTYRVNRDLYPRLNAYPNLYVETSGLQQHCGIQDMCEQLGSDRLLFGSRLPFFCPGAAMHAIQCADIPDAAKVGIAGANLRHLLNAVRL